MQELNNVLKTMDFRVNLPRNTIYKLFEGIKDEQGVIDSLVFGELVSQLEKRIYDTYENMIRDEGFSTQSNFYSSHNVTMNQEEKESSSESETEHENISEIILDIKQQYLDQLKSVGQCQQTEKIVKKISNRLDSLAEFYQKIQLQVQTLEYQDQFSTNRIKDLEQQISRQLKIMDDLQYQNDKMHDQNFKLSKKIEKLEIEYVANKSVQNQLAELEDRLKQYQMRNYELENKLNNAENNRRKQSVQYDQLNELLYSNMKKMEQMDSEHQQAKRVSMVADKDLSSKLQKLSIENRELDMKYKQTAQETMKLITDLKNSEKNNQKLQEIVQNLQQQVIELQQQVRDIKREYNDFKDKYQSNNELEINNLEQSIQAKTASKNNDGNNLNMEQILNKGQSTSYIKNQSYCSDDDNYSQLYMHNRMSLVSQRMSIGQVNQEQGQFSQIFQRHSIGQQFNTGQRLSVVNIQCFDVGDKQFDNVDSDDDHQNHVVQQDTKVIIDNIQTIQQVQVNQIQTVQDIQNEQSDKQLPTNYQNIQTVQQGQVNQIQTVQTIQNEQPDKQFAIGDQNIQSVQQGQVNEIQTVQTIQNNQSDKQLPISHQNIQNIQQGQLNEIQIIQKVQGEQPDKQLPISYQNIQSVQQGQMNEIQTIQNVENEQPDKQFAIGHQNIQSIQQEQIDEVQSIQTVDSRTSKITLPINFQNIEQSVRQRIENKQKIDDSVKQNKLQTNDSVSVFSRDYLNILNNENIYKLLKFYNDSSIKYFEVQQEPIKYQFYSDLVIRLNEKQQQKKRVLFITNQAMYILYREKYKIYRRILLKDIHKVQFSNSSLILMKFIIRKGQDLVITTFKRTDLVLFLMETFRDQKLHLFERELSAEIFSNKKQNQGQQQKSKKKDEQQQYILNPEMLDGYMNSLHHGYFYMKKKGLFKEKFKQYFFVLTNIGLICLRRPEVNIIISSIILRLCFDIYHVYLRMMCPK